VDEKPIEIPGSRWEWLLADKRRLAALIVGVLVVLGAVAALAVPALFGPEDPGGEPPTGQPVVPGGTDATATPGAGDEPTGTAEDDPGAGGANGDGNGEGNGGAGPGGSGTGGGSSDGGPATVVPGRAPYVAYRFDGAVWVSREDGSGPVKVAESEQGSFALSPDGTALALVEEGELSIIGVTDRSLRVIGDAEPRSLAWQADSSTVLYLRAMEGGHGVTEVWRAARRTGVEPLRVVQAGVPSVALDGTIAALPIPGVLMDPPEGSLWVLPGGRSPRELTTRGWPSACDVEVGMIAYAVSGMTYTDAMGTERQVDPEIWVMRVDGSAQRRLVGKPDTPRPFGYGNLMLSPDGQRLLYAEVGDDGYSRAWVVPLAGGTPVPLTVRRDTYPLGWSADGTGVFFIEGNAFQGEATALVSARADGMGRRTVIQGAGL